MPKMSGNAILSTEINPSKIRGLQRRVDKNGDLIDDIVNKLVHQYCSDLDNYMHYILEVLNDAANPPTNEELDGFTLNLPVLIYFAGEAQESLGIKEDVAKAIKQERFNETYEQSTGTIADKTAAAELSIQDEYITHIAYARAYKKIKLRIDAANETLQSVKKVISRRMVEYEVSKVNPNRMEAYNEQA